MQPVMTSTNLAVAIGDEKL